MLEPHTNVHVLTGGSRVDVRGYEHSIAVEGSPSRIVVGEGGRHGNELAVIRESVLRSLPPQEHAVMLGESTEAWVSMTCDIV